MRGPPRGGRDRYDDRRGGGSRRYDDYRGGRYDSYDRRGDGGRDYPRSYGGGGREYGRDYNRDYGRRGDYRDDNAYRGGGGVDRYAGREDRYPRGGDARGGEARGGDDRRDDRAGGDDRRAGYYDRDANPPSYDQAPARDGREAYGGRTYEARGDERYSAR